MWTSLRLYVPVASLVPVAGLIQELSVRAHTVPVGDGSGAMLYLIHPHSPTDRLRFSQLEGVKFLPHPFSPVPVSKEVMDLFPTLDVKDNSAYSLWSELYAKNPHPVLDPEA